MKLENNKEYLGSPINYFEGALFSITTIMNGVMKTQQYLARDRTLGITTSYYKINGKHYNPNINKYSKQVYRETMKRVYQFNKIDKHKLLKDILDNTKVEEVEEDYTK